MRILVAESMTYMRRHRTDTTAGYGKPNHGSNLLGVGQYNERLILQLIRRAGSLPKAEIARMTKLSAQTVSVIINRLLQDKLLRKRPRQREKGKVGQPAVPIALNPGGAYSIGVKIGRRSLDVLVIDFAGMVLQRISHPYAYPDPEEIFPTIKQDIETLAEALTESQRERIVGVGVAAPYALGGWQQAVGAPQEVLAQWDKIDIRQKIADTQSKPVWFSNDATAAAIAELEFGNGASFRHYLYVFVGTFIGGGVVLNGELYAGAFDNAGAIGSMPVPAHYAAGLGTKTATRSDASSVQLIHCASRYLLDDMLRDGGMDPDSVIDDLGNGQIDESRKEAAVFFEKWLSQAAPALAYAVVGAVSFVDFEGVVIDGAFPPNLVGRLAGAVDDALDEMNLEGLVRPEVRAGTTGSDARALGGAILPFYSSFAPDRDVLLNVGTESA